MGGGQVGGFRSSSLVMKSHSFIRQLKGPALDEWSSQAGSRRGFR